MQSYDEDQNDSKTFTNKVLFEVAIFIEIMMDLVMNFYEKEVALEDLEALEEDINKLVTHVVVKKELHTICLILSRV